MTSLTLAHPLALLGALAGIVPLAVAVVRTAGERRLRRELGLGDPSLAGQLARPAALACLFCLLGFAAAEPSIRVQHGRLARTDAQMVVAIDSSRSMLASSGRHGIPRYRRAVAFARKLRAELPQLPAGISSLTNRILPYLFPTSDARAFDLVLDQAYGIERPPPALTAERWVTTFDPLNDVAAERFFSPTARKRVLVVLSDAETREFDSSGVLRRLELAGTTPIVVRFWHRDERIFRPGGADATYRATQPDSLEQLRGAGWPAYSENDRAAVVSRIRAAIGSGPLERVGYGEHETSLAPVVALLALAPLLFLVVPPGRLPGLAALRS